MTTVKIEVDVELDDIESFDLIEELRDRGEYEDISSCDTEDLLSELRHRNESTEGLDSLIADPRWAEWLRKLEPPQEVRDAFFNATGRILL